MFAIGYGSEQREKDIRTMEQSDHTTALILAAVHFEWMLKRTILKLGSSPTKDLRRRLEGVYRVRPEAGTDSFKAVWREEVEGRYRNAALGKVLGRLQKIQDDALDVRGAVIHGNGTVSRDKAHEAIELFLNAGERLRDFAGEKGEDLDSRLKPRLKMRQKN